MPYILSKRFYMSQDNSEGPIRLFKEINNLSDDRNCQFAINNKTYIVFPIKGFDHLYKEVGKDGYPFQGFKILDPSGQDTGKEIVVISKENLVQIFEKLKELEEERDKGFIKAGDQNFLQDLLLLSVLSKAIILTYLCFR